MNQKRKMKRNKYERIKNVRTTFKREIYFFKNSSGIDYFFWRNTIKILLKT